MSSPLGACHEGRESELSGSQGEQVQEREGKPYSLQVEGPLLAAPILGFPACVGSLEPVLEGWRQLLSWKTVLRKTAFGEQAESVGAG